MAAVWLAKVSAASSGRPHSQRGGQRAHKGIAGSRGICHMLHMDTGTYRGPPSLRHSGAVAAQRDDQCSTPLPCSVSAMFSDLQSQGPDLSSAGADGSPEMPPARWDQVGDQAHHSSSSSVAGGPGSGSPYNRPLWPSGPQPGYTSIGTSNCSRTMSIRIPPVGFQAHFFHRQGPVSAGGSLRCGFWALCSVTSNTTCPTPE